MLFTAGIPASLQRAGVFTRLPERPRRLCKADALPSRFYAHQRTSPNIHNLYGSHRSYTRRFFGGRHPLCGTGVTSVMLMMSRPFAFNARIAASLPEPGPFTNTSTAFKP